MFSVNCDSKPCFMTNVFWQIQPTIDYPTCHDYVANHGYK